MTTPDTAEKPVVLTLDHQNARMLATALKFATAVVNDPGAIASAMIVFDLQTSQLMRSFLGFLLGANNRDEIDQIVFSDNFADVLAAKREVVQKFIVAIFEQTDPETVAKVRSAGRL